MRCLLLFLLLLLPPVDALSRREPPVLISRIAKLPTSAQQPLIDDKALQAAPPLILDLTRLGFGPLTSRLAVAKLATILTLMYGIAFRFADTTVASALDMKATGTNRMLIRRMGRRVLALGAAAYNLFLCGTNPMTAIATSGTVLLLDRFSREREKQQKHKKSAPANNDNWRAKHERRQQRGWQRFMDQCKLHVHSILAWSGVLHPLFPWTRDVVQGMGILLFVGAMRDIFLPSEAMDALECPSEASKLSDDELLESAVLCQASGYVMTGLSVFVVALTSRVDSLNAFGLALIANLYSSTCLFPYAVAITEKDEGTTTQAKGTILRQSLRKALYFAWLLANGAVAATLAAPAGGQASAQSTLAP